jgi:hypothetical protein
MLLRLLEEWLKRDYPRDVLMPVAPGTKRPESVHKDGAWGWPFWDKARRKDQDVCVLLRDLCVIDVDNEELVQAYEGRFPLLNLVPCEQTKKGRHYWFVRPSWADAEGYWDGAAQREKGVDFKSVCKTGTSGIVVVAPSQGKSWLRAPWSEDAELTEMPRDLLDAVAVPSAPVVDSLILRCLSDDSTIERVKCRWAPQMEYIKPFLNEEDDVKVPETGIPLPSVISAASVRELFEVLDHGGVLSGRHPRGVSREALRDAQRAADFLGLDFMLTGSPAIAAQLDVASTFGVIDNTEMVVVDAELSERLRYEPFVEKNECWLFGGGRMCGGIELQPGERVLAASFAETRIAAAAEVVLEILRIFAGRVALAGGAALWAASADGFLASSSPKDYDLFVIADTDEEATEIAKGVISIMRSAKCRELRSSRAITFLCADNELIVQVILKRHSEVRDVIRAFDLPPCKIVMWYDHEQVFRIGADREFVESMRRGAFWLDSRRWTYSTVARVIKYHHKGFDVFVPGTRRGAIRQASGFRLKMMHTIADLFQIERDVLHARKSRSREEVRMPEELRVKLGYASAATKMSRLVKDILERKATKIVKENERSSRCWTTKTRSSASNLYVLNDPDFVAEDHIGKELPKMAAETAIRQRMVERALYDRLSLAEVQRYSCMCRCASNYESRLKLSGSLKYILSRTVGFARRLVSSNTGLGIVPLKDEDDADAWQWHTPASIEEGRSTLDRRRVVNLPALYNMPALRRILEIEAEAATSEHLADDLAERLRL